MSHGRAGSLSVAETLQAPGTVPGVSSPVLRSSASGVSGMFGGARKVEVRTSGGGVLLRLAGEKWVSAGASVHTVLAVFNSAAHPERCLVY